MPSPARSGRAAIQPARPAPSAQLHQVGIRQDLQVLPRALTRNLEALRNSRDGERLSRGEPLHHLEPYRIAQRPENRGEFAHALGGETAVPVSARV